MNGHETAGATGGRTAGLPRHVAIIMDGNGRWARSRGLPRAEGHRRGVQSIRTVVRHARELGIDWLTLFSFSSENWSRPADEVSELMGLLKLFIRRDLKDLAKANVRVHVIGGRDNLTSDIAELLIEAEERTADNTGLNLVIAFNYGSRDEIVRAARALARDVAAGRLAADEVTAELVASRLDTADMPDPDLIIRSSGEQRLSNFLLWQAAYAEFVFVPDYWPDFDGAVFDRAIAEYMGRERRFGRLPAEEQTS